MADLAPPRKSVELQDAGAHDLQASKNDQTSDRSSKLKSNRLSIPTTRVERVDDEPSHGEVPGTEAFDMRTADATPDEFEVIPESVDLIDRSQSTTEESEDLSEQDSTLKTAVEKTGHETPGQGDARATTTHDAPKVDVSTDASMNAAEDTNGTPTSIDNRSPTSGIETTFAVLPKSRGLGADLAEHASKETGTSTSSQKVEDDEEFGDDFDDFEDGDEVEDFGDFDNQEKTLALDESQNTTSSFSNATIQRDLAPQITNFDWDGLQSFDEIVVAMQPIIRKLLPAHSVGMEAATQAATDSGQSLLTERSQSLWAQLVAPPPLQPPNWVQSRIRRLFLVSLGVPVDLDEILPASKQKKLVLPSLETEAERSPAHYEDVVAARQHVDGSLTSVDSSTSKPDHKRRGPAPPPFVDLNSARRICSTTDAALRNFTVEELKAHLTELDAHSRSAQHALEYWMSKRDNAQGDKATFEEVIENLVKHAKRVRK